MSPESVLAYYDVKNPVTISYNASQFGLSALLLQDSKPVAYASKALTDPETHYAQIEKELLAVFFALIVLSVYLWKGV